MIVGHRLACNISTSDFWRITPGKATPLYQIDQVSGHIHDSLALLFHIKKTNQDGPKESLKRSCKNSVHLQSLRQVVLSCPPKVNQILLDCVIVLSAES